MVTGGYVVHSRFSRKAGKIGGWAMSATVLSAIAAGFFLYQFSKSPSDEVHIAAPAETDRGGHPTGSIVMRGGADGACRQFKFDNTTGDLRRGVDVACNDKAPATNSTEGRMNAVRDAFSRK
jgi:hypothetical protein